MISRKLNYFLLPLFFLTISFVRAQKPNYDVEMGKEYAMRVEQVFGVYENAEMGAYVESVGNRLVAAMDSPLFNYSFKIITNPTPNAFALPGGYTYITTGLLPILESEDELACIMAHEIIHANNRHAVKSMKRGILPAILQIPGNVVGLFSPGAGEMINRPIKGFGDLSLASYSRKNETEADVKGIALASKAGYDPKALESALTRLGKYIELLTGQKEEKGYLDDHPLTTDRVERLEKEIDHLEYSPIGSLSENFNSEFNGILYGENPAHGVVLDSTFYNPEYQFKVQIPEKWLCQMQQSTFAMMEPNKKASLYISYAASDSTPKQMAQALRNQLTAPYKKIMVMDQEVFINNKPAHIMAFEQNDESNSLYAFMLWFRDKGTLFEISAMSLPQFRSQLEKIPYTLLPLSEQDRERIKIQRVELTEARKNESIQDLNKRISNVLSPSMTAVINNLTENHTFSDVVPVKVVLKESYFKE